MRVVFLAVDVDLTGYTGDVSHVKDIAVALSRQGCEVDLVVANPADWAAGNRIHLHRTPGHNTVRAGLALYRKFRSLPPDCIYERRGTPKLAALLSVLLDRPYFVEINGLIEEEKAMQGRPEIGLSWIRSIRQALRGRLLRGAAGVVAVTEPLRRELIARHSIDHNRTWTVQNGVDVEAFQPMDRWEARANLGLNEPGPFLVFVGNIVAWQGLDTLMNALTIVRESIPSVRLLIVGDGMDRKALEGVAAKLGLQQHVLFVGRAPRTQVSSWIAAADLAVMPSTRRLNERIGRSALKLREYLACGRPVVAANIEGGGPFVEQRGVGVSFECDDPSDFAEKITAMLKDPNGLQTQGARARQIALAELTWARAARSLLEIFRSGTGGSHT